MCMESAGCLEKRNYTGRPTAPKRDRLFSAPVGTLKRFYQLAHVHRLQCARSGFPAPFFAEAPKPGVFISFDGRFQTGVTHGFSKLLRAHGEQGSRIAAPVGLWEVTCGMSCIMAASQPVSTAIDFPEARHLGPGTTMPMNPPVGNCPAAGHAGAGHGAVSLCGGFKFCRLSTRAAVQDVVRRR